MKLFEPLQIGTMVLKNRVIMAPMGTGYANEDGTVSQRLIDYYARRAAGGVSMIVLEHHMVHPSATGVGPELRLDDDRFIPGQARLVEALHRHGVKVGPQLNHPGRQTTLGTPIGPSPIPVSPKGKIPHALSDAEVEELVEAYAECARRARDAGHDFVEVHGAHGYMVSSFLSPLSNQRTDRWGGSTENRARFAVEIVRRIRQKVGPDYPVSFRISGSEFVEGGLTPDEAARIARLLEEAGVNCISISAGNWLSLEYIMMPMFMPEGALLEVAPVIKAAVRVPVLVVGRLGDPRRAEQALQEGRADAIVLGRALIADPDWARTVQSGQFDRVRPCIACNCCVDRVSLEKDAWCAVNPYTGFEGALAGQAEVSKRIVVVGGGPAGFSAAEVAARRGHRVTLLEKAPTLGGKVDMASYPPGKAVLHNFSVFMGGELARLGVEVRLNTEATPELIDSLEPDVVIVAAGARSLVPPFPGLAEAQPVLADDVLVGKATCGKRVVIMGGSATGCETTEWLLHRGHQVTLIEMGSKLGAGMEQIARRVVYNKLKKAGAEIRLNSKVVALAPGRVIYQDTKTGAEGAAEGDTLVLALGYRPDTRLLEALRARNPGYEVLAVGDARKPGNIAEAIRSAADQVAVI